MLSWYERPSRIINVTDKHQALLILSAIFISELPSATLVPQAVATSLHAPIVTSVPAPMNTRNPAHAFSPYMPFITARDNDSHPHLPIIPGIPPPFLPVVPSDDHSPDDQDGEGDPVRPTVAIAVGTAAFLILTTLAIPVTIFVLLPARAEARRTNRKYLPVLYEFIETGVEVRLERSLQALSSITRNSCLGSPAVRDNCYRPCIKVGSAVGECFKNVGAWICSRLQESWKVTKRVGAWVRYHFLKCCFDRRLATWAEERGRRRTRNTPNVVGIWQTV